MFTGLVQAVGVVAESRQSAAGARLVVDGSAWDHRPEPGESINVAGCCLTVAAPVERGRLVFDVVAETLARTTLGALRAGSRVNLERSLRPADLLGGHFVQGHVDGVGEVSRVQAGTDHRVWVRPPHELMDYMIPKGSVCVDGVSLTLAGLERDVFCLALIPVTLERTTLGALAPGARVNVEADILAKAVVYHLRRERTP